MKRYIKSSFSEPSKFATESYYKELQNDLKSAARKAWDMYRELNRAGENVRASELESIARSLEGSGFALTRAARISGRYRDEAGYDHF